MMNGKDGKHGRGAPVTWVGACGWEGSDDGGREKEGWRYVEEGEAYRAELCVRKRGGAERAWRATWTRWSFYKTVYATKFKLAKRLSREAATTSLATRPV